MVEGEGSLGGPRALLAEAELGVDVLTATASGRRPGCAEARLEGGRGQERPRRAGSVGAVGAAP
jgi:hypothetical protein